MSEWPKHYILIDRVPIAVDLATWCEWYESHDRHIFYDEFGKVIVSTIFLGIDHNWSKQGEPLLFETMIFGGPLDGWMSRHHTWAEAEAGHAKAVNETNKAAAEIAAIAKDAGANQ